MDSSPSNTVDASGLPVEADKAMGKRLKAAREAKDLSQKAVATRSKWADPDEKGISRTALIGYEAGTSRPGAREMRILCQTLGISANALLFGSENSFQTSHAAMEGLRGEADHQLGQAVQIALVLAALKGHERDALTSLALSLAGRQLGDLRLAGLRMLGTLLLPGIEQALKDFLLPNLDPKTASLEAMADALSREFRTATGTNLQIKDGEVVGGNWLYQDANENIKSST